ncbi:hypothetical protein [Rubrivirga sp. IMCC43871]|uniref:hypothetical protein n=1 Tax=Rubrivirga sp. IMCC43871 TaxID=3391575 RepID=UPI00398FE3D0
MPLRLALALVALLAAAACQSDSGDAEMDAQDSATEAYDLADRASASASGVLRPASQVDAPLPAERQLIRTAALRIRADDHAQGSRARARWRSSRAASSATSRASATRIGSRRRCRSASRRHGSTRS